MRARDVLAEPDLAVAYEDGDAVLAVEHQAHERFALEDDATVHGWRAPGRLLQQDADDAVAPLAAFDHLVISGVINCYSIGQLSKLRHME